jgi:hydrogenase maturation protease
VARTLVLGLGNELLRDDGVGLRAARRVAELAGDRADLAEACLANADLLPIVSGRERLIVVDAYVSSTDPPGTAVRATPADRPAGFSYRSFHTLPFDEVLALGHLLGLPMPEQVVIHGLCVEDASTFGDDLSPALAAAWPAWAEEIARQEFSLPSPRQAKPHSLITPMQNEGISRRVNGSRRWLNPSSGRCASPTLR